MKLEDVWNQMKVSTSFEEFKEIINSKRDEIIKEENEKLDKVLLEEVIEIDGELFPLFDEVVIDTKKFGIMENKLNTL